MTRSVWADDPDVPASPEGQRFLRGGESSQEPLFFETVQAAQSHRKNQQHRTMLAWRDMLRAYESPAVRERGVLALETYANAG